MNRARVASLLRELADELDRGEQPATDLVVRGVGPKRRRTHCYKPAGPVSDEAIRAVRRQAAKRGIPL